MPFPTIARKDPIVKIRDHRKREEEHQATPQSQTQRGAGFIL